MGELIYLDQRRKERAAPAGPAPTAPTAPMFLFDLASPESYLVAERIERTLGEAEWIPVDGRRLLGDIDRSAVHEWHKRAEALARAQRLPLVWPERFPASVPCAQRAASYACELGAGPTFALAAFRLAFCGGFDLDDPEVLAEAAAASAIPLDECLAAAGETVRDDELGAAAEHLRSRGVLELPAIRVEGRWFAGESGILAASAMLSSESMGSPLAPVG